MESYLLTLGGPLGPVLPRRVRLEVAPGTGRLAFPAAPPLDDAWRASVGAAWEAARWLTGQTDFDGHLEVVATSPLRGASAGLAVGLLAVGALTGEALPPHFGTGGVDAEGFFAGGRRARIKAEAAAQFAPQLGRGDAVFLAPPQAEASPLAGLPIRLAADLGAAMARLDPARYARASERHRALRAVPGAPDGPFAVVLAGEAAPPLPERVGGIAVLARPEPGLGRGAWVGLGQHGRLLWRTFLPDADALAGEVPRLHALARAAGP